MDDRYAPSQCLVYRDDGEARFWVAPKSPRQTRMFVARLLEGLEPWNECGLWRRGGYWPLRGRVGEWVGRFACGDLAGAGIFVSRIERTSLLRLMMRQVITGGCVEDDLFIIPDHGRAFLYVDHHDVIHASFATPVAMEAFVTHMAQGGYELPVELPDGTFKRPAWMT
ncbi:MAG TPA: hypothetical protein VH475_13620 [Tepidisphaeraceae bacterium]